MLGDAPSGLTTSDIVARCVADASGDGDEPVAEDTAAAVEHALEVLTGAVLVYQRDDVFCCL